MIGRILIGCAIFLYPFLIYFGLAHLGVRFFGAVLAALLVFRVRHLGASFLKKYLSSAIVGLVYVILVAVTGSETLLLFYPVVINLLLLSVFAHSQFQEKTLLEEFAALKEDTTGVGIKEYLRVLNIIWCIFFGANAMLSGYIAYFRPMSDWALYNGFLSYVVVGALLIGEIVFRPFYKKAMLKRLN